MYCFSFEELIKKAKENLNNITEDNVKIGYEKCIADMEKIVDDAKKNRNILPQIH